MKRASSARALFAFVSCVALGACTGAIGGDDPTGASGSAGPAGASTGPGVATGGPSSSNGGTPHHEGGGAEAGTTITPGSDSGPAPAVDSGPSGPQPGVRDLATDRNLFFGASRCDVAGTKLCDGFENGLDTSVWSAEGTAPTVDTTHAARGTKSLHVRRAMNGNSRVRTSKPFPMPDGEYYGRAFFWFDTMPGAPAMDFSHWTIAAGTGTGVQGEIRIGGMYENGRNRFGIGTDSYGQANGTGDWTTLDSDGPGGGVTVPVGSWVCIEWMHSAGTNTTRFYWDAVEHPSLATTTTKNGGNGNPYLLPQFTDVWVGWDEYQSSSQTFELWVDEIAIDHQRIGCVL